MLAPLPVIVHVPDETVVLPTIPVPTDAPGSPNLSAARIARAPNWR